MVDKKVSTIMVLKVDLQCCRCYKKVKKILCKFPRNPEKIKQKIICKGGESIKSIEVKVPQKPANPTKETNQEKDPPAAASGKPNASDQPNKPKPADPNPPDSKGEPGIIVVPPPPTAVPPAPLPVPVDPFPRTCCRECYEGRSGGPCFYGGHGWPPPCYQYDGYVGWPVYDSYGGGRCSCYLVCEENTGPSCRIM
ncbi:hypothetical protein TIFTF001_006168 [Ficus carica]|uniref:Uncharacterized protein n=1 Tax=Ficus carica TaxID=3494 RepID=A0AA87ZGW5_FICCA|nr:hypothetical protein TIFTF001_006168 [Ficus carica]